MTVAGIERLRQAHLLAPEQRARLQQTVNLCKRPLLVRRVAGGLDGIARIERVGLDGAHVHEVALHVLRQVIEPRLDVLASRSLELLCVVVDAEDRDAGFAGDPAHRFAHAAPDVDDPHALAQLQPFDHQPLMADDRCLQRLAGSERREVQRLVPPELHEFAAQVVVVVDGVGVVVIAGAPVPAPTPFQPALEAGHAAFDVPAAVCVRQVSGQVGQHGVVTLPLLRRGRRRRPGPAVRASPCGWCTGRARAASGWPW